MPSNCTCWWSSIACYSAICWHTDHQIWISCTSLFWFVKLNIEILTVFGHWNCLILPIVISGVLCPTLIHYFLLFISCSLKGSFPLLKPPSISIQIFYIMELTAHSSHGSNCRLLIAAMATRGERLAFGWFLLSASATCERPICNCNRMISLAPGQMDEVWQTMWFSNATSGLNIFIMNDILLKCASEYVIDYDWFS